MVPTLTMEDIISCNPVAASHIWNSLPLHVTSTPSLQLSKKDSVAIFFIFLLTTVATVPGLAAFRLNTLFVMLITNKPGQKMVFSQLLTAIKQVLHF